MYRLKGSEVQVAVCVPVSAFIDWAEKMISFIQGH